jgi:hypothetical protein
VPDIRVRSKSYERNVLWQRQFHWDESFRELRVQI